MKHERPRRRFSRDRSNEKKLREIIQNLDEKLKDAIKPEVLTGLNSFERRFIHRHYDHDSAIETRTYRHGNEFTLYVYPVGNIEQFAREKAREVLDTGQQVDLPPMGSFERFIVHNCLKDIDGIETVSFGEGSERHVQIICKRFGRGLKRIAKKIKIF